MFEFSKVYVRSIVGILASSAVIAYLNPSDTTVLGGYLAAVVAMVMLDKGNEKNIMEE